MGIKNYVVNSSIQRCGQKFIHSTMVEITARDVAGWDVVMGIWVWLGVAE